MRDLPDIAVEAHDPDAPWDDRAACRGGNMTELFYSEEDEDIAEAKRICRTCEIRRECLERAIILQEKEGVWGGLTFTERRSLVRRRRRTALALQGA